MTEIFNANLSRQTSDTSILRARSFLTVLGGLVTVGAILYTFGSVILRELMALLFDMLATKICIATEFCPPLSVYLFVVAVVVACVCCCVCAGKSGHGPCNLNVWKPKTGHGLLLP
jgi:hypothetical protein